MKRYVLLLLALVASFNTASAATIELRGKDLEETEKGVEISYEVARLSGFLSDMLDQEVTGAIPLNIPHKAVELAVPNFTAAYEAYTKAAGSRVTEELRREHRSKMVKAMAPNMQELAKEDLVLLINAADYLNFPELLDATAPRTAEVLSWENLKYFREHTHDTLLLSEAIVRQVPDVLFPLVFDTPFRVQRFDPTWEFQEFSKDGSLVVMFSVIEGQEQDDHKNIYVIDLASGETLSSGVGSSVHISSDGARILLRHEARADEVWDVRKNERICTMQYGEELLQEDMSKDGRLILLSSEDNNSVEMWSTDTGTRIRSFRHIPEGGDNPVSFSHDDKAVITRFDDYIVRIWDVHSGKLLRRIPANDRPPVTGVIAFSVSAYGPFIGISEEGQVNIWNWETGKLLGELKQEGVILTSRYSNSFSADLRRVLLGGSWEVPGGPLINYRVWDIASQEELFSFPEEERISRAQYSLWSYPSSDSPRYSKDGSQITMMREEDVYIFNAKTGQRYLTLAHPFLALLPPTSYSQLKELQGYQGTADGKQLLTGFGNRVYTWDLIDFDAPAIRAYLKGTLKLHEVLFIMTFYREHLKDPKAPINLYKLAAKTPGVTGKELAAALQAFPPEIRKLLTNRFKIACRDTALRARRRRRYQRA